MRLIFIFLFATSLQVSAVTNGQTITANYRHEPLEKVISSVKAQTGYKFFYSNTMLKKANPVNATFTAVPLKQALNQIFSNQPLSFTIQDKTIIIRQKKTTAGTSSVQEAAAVVQQSFIHGTVTDTAGHPIAGASVVIVGTQTGTVTNSDGRYKLQANAGDQLKFSYIGYGAQTIKVGTAEQINVQLKSETSSLDDIVMIGYGSQKKINLTGAVVSVGEKEIKDRANGNLLNTLQGRVPGVTVISRPGSAPSINFRGRGNLGVSAPLFVIDGIISDATVFSNLDPNTIASVNFLKDAASSSIYGSRAAYGVVLVTTKTGKTGVLQIAYNGYVGSKSPTYIPDMLNSYEYASLYNEGLKNQGKDPFYSAEQIGWFKDGSQPDAYPNTNWFDLVLDKSAVTTQHSFSFSGGTDKTRYFTALSYLYDDQFIPNQDNKRYNLSTRLSSDVTSWLTLSTDISYFRTRNDRTSGSPSLYQMMYVPGTMVARQSNGEWGSIAGGTAAIQTYMTYNPLRALSKNDWNHSNHSNSIFNIGFDLKPVKGLTISGQGSYTGTETKSKSYSALQDNVLNFTTGAEIPGTGSTANKMDMSWGSTSRLLYTATAKYDWRDAKSHLTLLGGTSYEQNNYEGLSASRKNFPTDALTDINAGSAAPTDITNGGGLYEFALNSYFGRLNYSYLNRYLFEANIRTDGSSRFYKDARWGVFPSFSAGWIISQESFMKQISWINLLKLRGSYGTLGNINNVGNYDYFQSYNNNLGYNFDNQAVTGISESKPANEKLSWEKVAMTNVGIDLSLFQNKLSLSADYYIKKTSNILLGYNVPVEIGVINKPSQNIGKLENKGFELSLNYNNKVGELSYSVGGNLSTNNNKITDLGNSDNMIYGGGDKINYIYKVGQSIGAYYGYVTDGLYTQQEIDNKQYYVFGRIPNAGDVKYVPQRQGVAFGDNISGEDRTIIGCDVPDLTFGLNLSLQFKNFDLSAFGQGISGAEVAFENDAITPFFQGGNARKFHLGRWTTENPDPNAIYPRIYSGNSLDEYNTRFSSYSLFDADYFRVKNITLGYKLPKQLLERYDISGVRFYVALENMFTIRADKKMKDFDPETASGRALSIGTKTISFGLNVDL